MTAPITSKVTVLEHEKTDDKLLLPKRIIMWDVATRICHLGLVLSVSASLWYGYQTDPESSEFLYHMLAGLLALWFLAVRLVLACCGAHTARWRAFLHSPRAVINYLIDVLRWRINYYPGLNPATMVFAFCMHALLIALAVTGFDASWAASWHGVCAYAVMIFIGIHLSGLLLHTLRHRDASALSMVHGYAYGHEGTGLSKQGWWSGLLVAVLSALVIAAVVWGFSAKYGELHLPFCPVIYLPFIQQG
jgi:cytochrome b